MKQVIVHYIICFLEILNQFKNKQQRPNNCHFENDRETCLKRGMEQDRYTPEGNGTRPVWSRDPFAGRLSRKFHPETLVKWIVPLVLIVDQDQPRGRWPLGLVKETFPDSQGCVRQVVVRTANQKRLQGDVRKICLLEKAQWYLNSAVTKRNSSLTPDLTLYDTLKYGLRHFLIGKKT